MKNSQGLAMLMPKIGKLPALMYCMQATPPIAMTKRADRADERPRAGVDEMIVVLRFCVRVSHVSPEVYWSDWCLLPVSAGLAAAATGFSPAVGK